LSEEKMRTLRLLTVIIDGSNDAIFAKDTEGRYLLCNREMLRSSGKTLADVIGKTDEEVYSPEDAAEISKRDRSAMQWETPATFEERLTTIDGERDFLSTRGPIRDPNGNVLGVFGISRDITERKYIEERWKFALEGAGDGVWDWNIQTGDATFSKRYREMLGFSESEIGTTASEWIGRVHTDDMPYTMVAIREHLDGETPAAKAEFRMRCKDGSWKWILGRGMVVSRNGDGKPLRLVGTITDITERKHAEIALTESLRQMEKKELSKTRFLAAAGHDMRQPIAAANLFVDALKFTSLNERQSELIDRLGQSMGIFSSMLDRLLDISKFDAGLIKPQITSSNLEELLIWLDQNFAQTAIQKHLRFRLFYPTRKPLFVRTDIGLVQSVLMNLVSNAIKFTERGSVLIGVRQRGDKILVQVWDTGIGIAEADLSHIFDEFYQVANQQRSRDAGLGLGLSICQRAMSVLGSEVTCRSRKGRGSVFQFSLPLERRHPVVEPPVISDTASEVADNMLFRGKRVVLVEDDVLVSQAMISLLEGMGGEVKCFHSAEEALHHADVEHADYHIVDYMLGGTHNGIQFLNLLRQKRGKPLKAVLMTGDTSSTFIRKAATLDWPVLHKPLNVSRLISSLSVQDRVAQQPSGNN
ncbi:MAG: PAS domain-containing protein, partial [Sideroxydans sp.]